MECLKCSYRFTDHKNLNNEEKPKKGDYTVCIDCGTIGIFDKELNLVPIPVGTLEILKSKNIDTWNQLMKASELIKRTRPLYKEVQKRQN
jgi:hypothetical protein